MITLAAMAQRSVIAATVKRIQIYVFIRIGNIETARFVETTTRRRQASHRLRPHTATSGATREIAGASASPSSTRATTHSAFDTRLDSRTPQRRERARTH